MLHSTVHGCDSPLQVDIEVLLDKMEWLRNFRVGLPKQVGDGSRAQSRDGSRAQSRDGSQGRVPAGRPEFLPEVSTSGIVITIP